MLNKYPILRGMAFYSILYPASNATQQILDPVRIQFDLNECLRFGILGTFCIAPTLYGWVRVINIIIKGNTLKHCLLKAYIEPFIWAPVLFTQFYVGINLLEGKSLKESVEQLKAKFLPTWKVGFCVWPILQTVNYKFIPLRNRVPFISLCSFLWNVFLSYMHNRNWDQKVIKNA